MVVVGREEKDVGGRGHVSREPKPHEACTACSLEEMSVEVTGGSCGGDALFARHCGLFSVFFSFSPSPEILKLPSRLELVLIVVAVVMEMVVNSGAGVVIVEEEMVRDNVGPARGGVVEEGGPVTTTLLRACAGNTISLAVSVPEELEIPAIPPLFVF